MKTLLIVLLVINIIALTIGFIALLTSSIILAIIYLAFGLLALVPTIAVIKCLDDIELMQENMSYLYSKIHKLEGNDEMPFENPEPTARYGVTSDNTWQCVKCGTINKAGTTNCSNCNDVFSPMINPTYKSNPEALSRWIKPKKRKY